ncbi:MAG TPA: hypothetical protein DER09_08930 [Prolixibacteraceae bacterium]|nr:hypothetical protein [Prolixibacteraceae bacterium]
MLLLNCDIRSIGSVFGCGFKSKQVFVKCKKEKRNVRMAEGQNLRTRKFWGYRIYWFVNFCCLPDFVIEAGLFLTFGFCAIIRGLVH